MVEIIPYIFKKFGISNISAPLRPNGVDSLQFRKGESQIFHNLVSIFRHLVACEVKTVDQDRDGLGEWKCSAKRRKMTDFFQTVPTVPNNSQPQEFPGFLRRFQPTDVPCRQKHPVGRQRHSPVEPGTETSTTSPDNGEQSVSRGVYCSYSLR